MMTCFTVINWDYFVRKRLLPCPSSQLCSGSDWRFCNAMTQSHKYSVSQKNPPPRYSNIFPKRMGDFCPKFTRLLYIPMYARLQIFIQLPATLMKLCHIKCDHPVHIINSNSPPSAKTHAGIFPKRLGIFCPNFTHILLDPIYARVQNFIQLSPIVTKLCYIKCDHPACISADGGHFERIMVVALNMA